MIIDKKAAIDDFVSVTNLKIHKLWAWYYCGVIFL